MNWRIGVTTCHNCLPCVLICLQGPRLPHAARCDIADKIQVCVVLAPAAFQPYLIPRQHQTNTAQLQELHTLCTSKTIISTAWKPNIGSLLHDHAAAHGTPNILNRTRGPSPAHKAGLHLHLPSHSQPRCPAAPSAHVHTCRTPASQQSLTP